MRRLIRLHPPLMITALLMAALTVWCLIGLAVDDRVLLGVPIWLKPLKFSISVMIYSVTLAWLISLLTKRRLASAMGTVIAVTALIELAAIVGQAARGHRSHFNFATTLDGALFTLMAISIVVLWLATVVVAVQLIRQRIASRPAAYAIRAGIVIAIAGLAEGFFMTRPKPGQIETASSGGERIFGAHSIGVADGGNGLPFVNWSTEGGDLRVGHFIGMHALQALPLFALALMLLGRRFGRLADEQTRARLVLTAAAAYAGLTALVTWQALRGQSIVHPDGLTWAAAGVLGVVVIAGIGWSLTRVSAPLAKVATR
ncbi:MAG: hypothetical protein HOU81_16210 [Hamadaea sp.]|uniref:hypothetical protein n=1 Tax=Hamadaea sp. TaxID=2024425 RepID=UPI00182A8104|nr:hypothetical protein [Hamadaea sp.]NUR72359.1 hypothetical protein [Hamadaea sp.]NUT20260.1 hypothetical protein [Hamadaea sp.]